MKFHSSRIVPLLISIGGSPFSDAFVNPQLPASPISSFGRHESIQLKRSQSSTHEKTQLHSLPKFFQQLSQNASINLTPNATPSKEPSSQTSSGRSSQLNASKTMVKDKTSNDQEKASNEKTNNTPRPPSTPPQIYENRVNILQHALTEKTQLVQTLEQRLSLVTDATQKLQVSNRDLLSQLQVLQGSSSSEAPSSASSSDSELEQLQLLEQEFQSSTRAYQSKLQSKQSKYRTLQSAYRSLESQLQSLQKEHDRVQEDVVVLTTKLEVSELECEGLEIQSLQQLEEIELLEQELELMQASQQDDKEESTAGRIPLEIATAEPLLVPNEEEEQVRKELEDKVNSLQDDKESLQLKLTTMEKSYETAKQQFQELNQVYKDRRGKLESLLQEEKENSASLKISLAESVTETKRVRRERNAVQSALDSVKAQFHELQQRMQDMRHHSKVHKKNARISHAAYQLSKGRNEELEKQVIALSCENEELRNQLQQYQRIEREQFVDQSHWKEREAEWKSHIEGLYSQLAQLSNRCTSLKNEKQIVIQNIHKERLEQETAQAKEKMEWKVNLVNLKSDYEELIKGFKTEIDRLTEASITEDANANDDTTTLSNTKVTLGTEDEGLQKDVANTTEEATDEGVGALSKRKRVRSFLRNKAKIARTWCTRTTNRFSDSF